jgi:serine phosphatase RsbU (regulator of sigma subunit)
MRAFDTPRARIALIAAMFAALFVLRAVVDEPGPLLLIPVLLSGLWFGERAGVVAALVAAGVYAVTREIRPYDDGLGIVGGTLVRVLVYGVAGAVVGRLTQESRTLATRVEGQSRKLEDLEAVRAALAPADLPTRPGLDIAALWEPAADGIVGGDFHLVAEGPESSTVVAVGDVVGKGPDAAGRAAFVRTTIASLIPFTDDPCRILELTNDRLIERTGTTMDFTTVVCVAYRPAERRLSWAFAGHLPPHWLDTGTPLNGAQPGFPLGVERDVGCTSNSLSGLDPGTGVILFTDGLSEARKPGADVFGEVRIVHVLAEKLGGKSPQEVVDRLRREAEDFAEGPLADDLCMVALRVK